MLTALGDEMRTRLEADKEFKEFQVWARDTLPDLISELQRSLDRIEFVVTQTGSDVAQMRDEMQVWFNEIAAMLRNGIAPTIANQAQMLVTERRAPGAMLWEGQVNYLERHGLFAGRESDLTRIRAFLQSRSKGYVFVTGRAGFGKSALVANLIGLQRDRYSWYFLNQLDNTHTRVSFLRQTCEQMLAYYQMPLRSEADLPEREDRLESLYSKLIRMPLVQPDNPLVLVIDGVDEAEGGFISDVHIPRELPDGKFVIFSARATGQDWVRDLGLPEHDLLRVELETLDSGGIKELLRLKGGDAQAWADDSLLVAEVERVSEGDPFYLRLMVDDIAEGAMSPAQISTQPSGLTAYLDKWWDQIGSTVRRDTELRDLLGTLMVSLGPLPRSDVVRMYPDIEWSLDDLLNPRQPFRRLVVVGGTDREPTYALAHPRFREYLSEHKLSGQAARYQSQLIEYCARWPEHGGEYALRHYAAHLMQAGEWEGAHALMATGDEKQAFAEARNASEGSYAGYLADLGLLWAHANEEGERNPAAVGRQVRYALIQSSITSLVRSIPAELIVALVQAGVWSGQVALAYARHHSGEAVAQVSVVLWQRGDKEVAHRAMAEALILIQFGDDRSRAKALAALAPHLPEVQRRDALADALAVARGIGDESYRAKALAALAPHLPPKLLAEALAAARGIGHESYRAEALAALAPHLPPELLADALAAAKGLGNESSRARVLAALAPHLPPDALAAARGIHHEPSRAEVLAGLVHQWISLNHTQAYELWRSTLHVSAGRRRDDLLSDLSVLVPIVVMLGGEDAAAVTCRAIQDTARWWP